jgi:metal-sulfur cluster biosynthetic enzyme
MSDPVVSLPVTTSEPTQSAGGSCCSSTSLPSAGEACCSTTPAASAETPAAPPSEGDLLDALRKVIDPELMINVVDLGLVYAIVLDGSTAKVEMTLTSPACPAGPQIVQQSKQSLERVPGISTAEIKLVLSPPWTPDRMTDEARDQLGIF